MALYAGLYALLAVTVGGWYVGEWLLCAEEGRRMKLVRHPVGIWWLAGKRLKRNWRFVVLLVGCWIASGITSFAVWHPLTAKLYEEQFSTPTPTSSEPAMLDSPSGTPGSVYQPGAVSWEWNVKQAFSEALPQFRVITPGGVDSSSAFWGFLSIAAIGVLGGVLIKLRLRGASWLPEDLREDLTWPINLAVAAFVVPAIYKSISAITLSRGAIPSIGTGWGYPLMIASGLLLVCGGGILGVVLWRLAQQVAEGERCSIRGGLIAAIETWRPVVGLMAVLWVVGLILLSGPSLLLRVAPGTPFVWDIQSLAVEWGPGVTAVVPVILLFIPWIILGGNTGLVSAVERNFAIIRSNWKDLLTCMVRHAVIAAPVYFGIECGRDAFRTIAQAGLATASGSTLLGLILSAFNLLMLVGIALLYERLRAREPALDCGV